MSDYGRALLDTLLQATRQRPAPVAIRMTQAELNVIAAHLTATGILVYPTDPPAIGTKIAGMSILAMEGPVGDRFIYQDTPVD